MKRYKRFILTLIIFSIFCRCSGGGGGDDESCYINIKNCEVSQHIVSKSSPQNLIFSWDVNFSSINKEYFISVYLSKDELLDESDNLIFKTISNKSSDTFILNPYDVSYQTILNAYGGKYYIIFDASVEDQNNSCKHSIKVISNFVIKTRWTFMVFMNGDNNLSGATFYDLAEMEEIGSTSDVNVVVQKDTNNETTKLYFIKSGESELIKDLGELDMGDYMTLVNFGKWVVDNYPADHYILVLWDHGKGFEWLSRRLITKDISIDETSNHSISIPDLAKALNSIKEKIGKKIDIIVMDACLMNMIEVAYEIKESAKYLVASENIEPWSGLPYQDVLTQLTSEADYISPMEFAKRIVQVYINSYSVIDDATMSVIDLTKISDLKNSVDKLAYSLINNLEKENRDILKGEIFSSVQRFDNGDYPGISPDDDSYVDLYHLCFLIKEKLPDFSNIAQDVIDKINQTVLISESIGSNVENSYGISIWFPNLYFNENQLYLDYYKLLLFAKDTHWDEFLVKLWE